MQSLQFAGVAIDTVHIVLITQLYPRLWKTLDVVGQWKYACVIWNGIQDNDIYVATHVSDAARSERVENYQVIELVERNCELSSVESK